MKKFLIACACIAGAYGLWRYFEYKKGRKIEKEDEEENADTDSVDIGFRNNGNTAKRADIVVGDPNVVTVENRINYDLYADRIRDIRSVTVPEDEQESERRRRKFENSYGVDIDTAASNEEPLTATMTSYIEYSLSYIDKQQDTKIWTLLAAMFGYEFSPTDYQKEAEEMIITKMRSERELYFGERYPGFNGTAAELLLYFARRISYDIDYSQAGVLEKLLTNGRFFDAIDVVGNDIKINDAVLESRCSELFVSDMTNVNYNIFGDKIAYEIEEFSASGRTWGGQMSIYIANELGEKEY